MSPAAPDPTNSARIRPRRAGLVWVGVGAAETATATRCSSMRSTGGTVPVGRLPESTMFGQTAIHTPSGNVAPAAPAGDASGRAGSNARRPLRARLGDGGRRARRDGCDRAGGPGLAAADRRGGDAHPTGAARRAQVAPAAHRDEPDHPSGAVVALAVSIRAAWRLP